MANKVITLSDIRVVQWTVNVQMRHVRVRYHILDDQDAEYGAGDAIFWETLPAHRIDADGDPIPHPPEWYQLPAQYSQILTDLTLSIRMGLLHLIEE